VGALLVAFIFFGGCFYLDSLLAFASRLWAQFLTGFLVPTAAAACRALEAARVGFVEMLMRLGIGRCVEGMGICCGEVVPAATQCVRILADGIKLRVEDTALRCGMGLRAVLPGPVDALSAAFVGLGSLLGRAWGHVLASCGYFSDKVSQQYHELAAEKDSGEQGFDVGKAFTTPQRGVSSTPPKSALAFLVATPTQRGGFTPSKKSWVAPTSDLDA